MLSYVVWYGSAHSVVLICCIQRGSPNLILLLLLDNSKIWLYVFAPLLKSLSVSRVSFPCTLPNRHTASPHVRQ